MKGLEFQTCVKSSLSVLVLLIFAKVMYNMLMSFVLRPRLETMVLYLAGLCLLTVMYFLAGFACGYLIAPRVRSKELNGIFSSFLLWLEYVLVGILLIDVYLGLFPDQPDNSPARLLVFPILDFQHNVMINPLFIMLVVFGGYLGAAVRR